MIAVLAGAGILAASVAASSDNREVDSNVEQFMENRKKGIPDAVIRAQQATSGALTPFAPFNAPRQDLKTVTEIQQASADDFSDFMVNMARFNLRPKGKQRIPIANTGNAPYLIKVLGNGTMGGIKGAETLNSNPMTTRGNIDWRSDQNLMGTAPNSGWASSDNSSGKWTPDNRFLNPGGVTFNQRINPWARGGKYVTLQQQEANQARGKQMPTKGPLVPIPSEGRKGTNIVM